jgi:hypothetical protein
VELVLFNDVPKALDSPRAYRDTNIVFSYRKELPMEEALKQAKDESTRGF